MRPVWVLARTALLLCLLCLAPWVWGAEGRQAVGGVLDLRGWDGREAVTLDGQWGVAWPSLPAGTARSAFIRVPGLWNTLPGSSSGMGMAVYSLRLYLPPDSPPLSLRIPQILSANRVLLDGRVVLTTGQVAASAQDEQPRILTRFVTVPAGREVLDLRIEVSNHFHVEGGIGNSLSLGPSEVIAHNFDRPRLLYAGVICTLLLLAVYIALFARHAPLGQRGVLTVLLLDLALRLLCTSELLKLVFPDIPEKLALHLEYAVIYIWPAYFYLLRAFFPSCTHRWVGVVLTVLGAAGLIGTVVLPTPVLTSFRDITSSVLVGSALYYAACIGLAIYRRLPGAGLLGVGLLFALVAAVHDALMYAHFFKGTDIAPVGILVFMFAHFVELGRRVGQSLEDVRRLSDELSLVNAGLERQVDQRTREIRAALDELTAAKDRAEAETRVKNLFLANISHEVRTPVNLILGMARLLQNSVQEGDSRRYLELMDRSGKNLVSLLDDILDLSRLESGKATLLLQPAELDRFFGELADMARFLCEEKGLRFVSRFDGLDAPVLLDLLKMRQVLVNLLGNAVKFTDHGEVVLEAKGERTPAGLRLRCVVSDTGPGISPEAREHVFDVFGRDARTTHIKGSGLGLAIVRRLVELMAGGIELENRPEGGTRFRLDFMLANSECPAVESSKRGAALPSPGRLHILLAEDTPENTLLIQEYLKPAGHALRLAASGREALAWLEREPFDLILLDMRLGDIDGEEVARAIRHHARPAVAHMPIIAITANVSAADRQRYDDAGVDEVLPKPLDLDELLDALARHAPSGGTGVAGATDEPATSPAAAARRAFDEACRACLATLDRFDAPSTGRERTDAVLRVTHRLRGGAASFGQAHLAQLAETLEYALTSGRKPEEPRRALQDALRAYLDLINP